MVSNMPPRVDFFLTGDNIPLVKKMLDEVLSHPCAWVFDVYASYYQRYNWWALSKDPPPYSLAMVVDQLDCGIYRTLSDMCKDLRKIRDLFNGNFPKESLERICMGETFRIFNKGLNKLGLYTLNGWNRSIHTLIMKVQILSTMDLPPQAELRGVLSLPLLRKVPCPEDFIAKDLQKPPKYIVYHDITKTVSHRERHVQALMQTITAVHTKEQAARIIGIIQRNQPDIIGSSPKIRIDVGSLNTYTIQLLVNYAKSL